MFPCFFLSSREESSLSFGSSGEWWPWLCHASFFNAFVKRVYDVLEVVLCFFPLYWGELVLVEDLCEVHYC